MLYNNLEDVDGEIAILDWPLKAVKPLIEPIFYFKLRYMNLEYLFVR